MNAMDLNYETSYINANYRMKVFGVNEENGKKINKLVGVSGLINLIGASLWSVPKSAWMMPAFASCAGG